MINRYSVMHSGILGMKHGHRRYQNSDGTWTEEGKAIRRAGGPAATIRNAVAKYKANRPRARDLSDADLEARITRLRNENTMKQLQDELYPSIGSRLKGGLSYVWRNTRSGRKFVYDFAGDVVKSTGKLVTDTGTKLGKAFVNDVLLESVKDGGGEDKGISDKALKDLIQENIDKLDLINNKSSSTVENRVAHPD